MILRSAKRKKDLAKLRKIFLKRFSQRGKAQSCGGVNSDEIPFAVPLNRLAVFCFHRNFLSKYTLGRNTAHEDDNLGINDCQLLVYVRLPVSYFGWCWR